MTQRDKRNHIGGNAYDHYDEHGILVHRYGPHIFHTNSRQVFEYLSKFTQWRAYEHRVLASVDGQLVPIPINLDTINKLYGMNLNSFEVEEFFKSVAQPREHIRTSEDVVVSKVGQELYEKFFRGYTRKQWGLDPSELDKSVIARIPTRNNRDDRYFTDTYQAMPLHGFTRMFENMLSHPNIKVMLNTNYQEIQTSIPCRKIVYTGPVDEFLVTRSVGYYESGVFDLRGSHGSLAKAQSPSPRPTAIATMVKDFASGRQPDHPVLHTPGWWHRQARLLYPPILRKGKDEGEQQVKLSPSSSSSLSPPLVIVGARGTLGRAFARLCEQRGIFYHLLTRQEMDITNPVSVDAALAQLKPWAVVNAAGYVRVDDAEREPNICLQVNTNGAEILATACAQYNVPLVTFSSDLVFDGAASKPYVETDTVAPLNVYGLSKALAEQKVLHAHPASLVIRTSAFFGPWDDYNFVTIALRQLSAGHSFVAAEDGIVSPTYVPDLVHACLDLLIDGESGLWHLANKSASGIAWADLARLAAKHAGVSVSGLVARPTQELGLIAKRPTYSVLGTSRGELLPTLENAIKRYFDEVEGL